MPTKDDMPTIGATTRRSAWGIAAGAIALVGLAGAAGALLRGRAPAPTPPAAVTTGPGGEPGAPTDADAGLAPGAVEGPSPDEVAAAGTIAGAPAPGAGTPSGLVRREGLIPMRVIVDGPLERSIVGKVGKDLGLPLTQVAVRSLVWWVDVPNDLRKGDLVDLLVEPRDGTEPVVQVVRFKSGKTGQTHRAYRFKPAGSSFARYYQPSGEELELRLRDAPLDDYEQVTSLLRDGRGHQGVDFRTPIGTTVKAPFDGTVARKNWNLKANGNSIELTEDGGAHRTALFLHLSTTEVEPGRHVKKGDAIALSGNTGHSFAPHLHYQMRSPSQPVLDPFRAHATFRASLPAEQKAAFDVEVKRLDALLDRAGDPG